MTAMTKFVILLGGDVTPTKRLLRQIEGATVLAADSGIGHAKLLGLSPILWIGDFDSSTAEQQKTYAHIPRQTFDAEKDATDGELAISEALRRGATELVLVGGFGGQFDHTMAHVGFLLSLARRGIQVFMTSGHEEAHALIDDLEFNDIAIGTRLSVVPVSDLKALTIAGVKWPLNRRDVPLGSALTLSNVVTGPVDIELKFGTALVVFYPRELE
jgi:thiamine pyrophosphokinase